MTFLACYSIRAQLNRVHLQIFTGFFKNVTRQINLTIRAKTTDLAQNFDWTLNLLECYTILTNNVQVNCHKIMFIFKLFLTTKCFDFT